jgi:hypothetical protein
MMQKSMQTKNYVTALVLAGVAVGLFVVMLMSKIN